LGHLSKVIDKVIEILFIMYFVICNWNTFWKYVIQHCR